MFISWIISIISNFSKLIEYPSSKNTVGWFLVLALLTSVTATLLISIKIATFITGNFTDTVKEAFFTAIASCILAIINIIVAFIIPKPDKFYDNSVYEDGDNNEWEFDDYGCYPYVNPYNYNSSRYPNNDSRSVRATYEYHRFNPSQVFSKEPKYISDRNNPHYAYNTQTDPYSSNVYPEQNSVPVINHHRRPNRHFYQDENHYADQLTRY